MKKKQILTACLAAVISLSLLAWLWVKRAESSTIRAISNIELSSDATLLEEKAHFTRLGSEGVRIRIYSLAPEYASQLKLNCKERGYKELSGREVGNKYPILQPYLDADDSSCVRSTVGEIRGVSVIQQAKLIVFIII